MPWRVVVILLACGVLSGSALAVEPRSGGDDTSADIFVVNADGTGRHDLTKGSTLDDDHPALSPDGRTIAFDRLHVEGGYGWGSVATMSSRGGPVRELFGGSSTDGSAYRPAWSPDGQLIAFNGCCPERVGIMRSNGRGLIWIPNAQDPTWLSSRRIAFLTDFSDAGALAIGVAKADGTERRAVVRGTDVGLMLIGETFASPNGRSIVFSAIDGRQNFARVYSMNLIAGSRPRFVSAHADASWSPTGRRLVVARSDIGEGLVTVRADGSRPRRFPATQRLYPQLPSWSPDGTRIAFIGSRSSSNYTLVVMNVRHRWLRVVARRVESRRPVWSWDGRRLYFVAESGS